MTERKLRNTRYAKELAWAANGNHRIERLLIHEKGTEEVRFSWWVDDRMKPRPLDLDEDDLMALLDKAIERGVFSPDFLARLRARLNRN